MMFELSVSHSRHYNRSFPLLSPDLRLIFNQTWFTKYLVLTAHGTTLARPADALKLEKKEHMRNVKSFARGSNIAKHAWSSNHSIDFKNSQVIDKGSSRIRKTLESWHTASTNHADKNSRPLPNQYSILLKKNN